jgi:Plasmid pRiA4b ORF-3-like protein
MARKRTKKLVERFPLSFSQAERETVLDRGRSELGPAVTRHLRNLPLGSQVISLSRKEVARLYEVAEYEALRAGFWEEDSQQKQILIGVLNKILDVLDGVSEGPAAGTASDSAKSDPIYQFKITLVGSDPPIWRRIQVEDGTLEELHEHIQAAMGWEDAHMHEFKIVGELYRNLEMLEDFDSSAQDSNLTTLSSLLAPHRRRLPFTYVYDFGDEWTHEILLEGCVVREPRVKYPRCVEGERACPPEDIGGIWGYYELLERSDDDDDAEDGPWCGPFDADKFDPKKASQQMRAR